MKKHIAYLTILFLLLITSSCCCYKGKLPKGLISQKEADAMEEAFKEDYYPCLEIEVDSTGKPVKREQGFPKEANSSETPKWYDDNRQGSLHTESDVYTIKKKLAHTNPISFMSKQIVVTNTSPHTINQGVREVWFSLNELQSFINMIKANTSVQDDRLGIRMYFGTYVNGKTRRVTLFLVATQYKSGLIVNSENFKVSENHENQYHILPLNYGNTGQYPIEYNPN